MSEAKVVETPKLGTFYGVFTPSILTILGVVLFLRTGWVVANVGLLGALSIVVVAHVVTFATALSVAAIATNMQVGAGGAYYLISRSLGLEIGGAIGIPLFLAQTFSVTLYAFGLAECLKIFWPEVPQQGVAAATILVVSILAGKSANLALKAQGPIMVAIGLALISLFWGASERTTEALPLFAKVADGSSYWQVLAVFFPAVTGLMAGVSMSGDLKDPTRSIVRGTLGAVLAGFVVYLAVPVALVAAASTQELASDDLIWFKIAAVPMLIYPGLIGAILSSALGSILGAPRTLEALSNDRIVPKISAGTAHVISTLVALGAVALGGINSVAPILTMFFLTTYGVVNMVAGLEQLSGSPSYRPTIRVHWLISLAGAVGCLWIMWLINPIAAVAAIVVEAGVYLMLRRRELSATWGDLRYGTLLSFTRASLIRLRRLPVHPRNWRPHILVFVDDLGGRIELIRFAAWLNQDRGILTVSRLLIGELENLAPQIAESTRQADLFLEEQGIIAFAETEVAADLGSGVLAICQANGMAGISSNTVMLGWSHRIERLCELLTISKQAALLGKSTILCRIAPRRWSSKLNRIDVWWGGLERNGDMLMLFAHLVSLNTTWAGAKIYIMTIASSAMTPEETQLNLTALLERCRIPAETRVFERQENEQVRQIIHRESGQADLVFMGLREPPKNQEAEYAERLVELVGDLPTVILVRAAGPFVGSLL